MIYLALPDSKVRILPFYLSMEEWAARHIGSEDIFFMWQVQPTVIFGRNQLIENEVNLDYCRQHGIQFYRRKSGGGCVYADMDNIMFSYITRSDNVTTTFTRYTQAVAQMLRGLGLNAESSGRNDVMVDGRKVSGNAFYHQQGRSIVHGTMLYDTNMDNMLHAITPSTEKLESKGVQSVKNHITTLNRYLTMSIDEFKDYARHALCDKTITMTDADVAETEEIMQSYLKPEFIFGNNPRCTVKKRGRIDNVGTFEVSVELKGNKIQDINLAGDFFVLGDINNEIVQRLKGVDFSRQDFEQALKDVDMGQIIMNLSVQELSNLIFNT